MKKQLIATLVISHAACVEPETELELGTAESESVIATPAGMGRYCSMSWPTGGWGFASYRNTVDDPCAFLRGSSTTATVERAGLYSLDGTNNVVLRCEGGSYIMHRVGGGNAPLTAAYHDADGHSDCVFTVSPKTMPIFDLPYGASGYTSTGTGFDFARGYTVDAKNDFGDPTGSTTASEMSWRGLDQSGAGGYINNHDGWDINLLSGTPIYAAAHGTVQAARFRDVTNVGCDFMTPTQGEVFVKHTISGGSNSNQYDEKLVTFYAHMTTIVVDDGDVVDKGDLIGYAGSTGCSSGPHLHFGVYRTRNTASERTFPFTINTNFASGQDQNSSNGFRVAIDPRGFSPPKGFDPWSWRGHPDGAQSINLWRSGEAPPSGGY